MPMSTMQPPELITRWSALVALAGATMVLGCWLGRLSVPGCVRRWVWTVSCALFLLHVGSAFGFYHHWSHADAYEATALRTRQTVGVDSGAGLYLNYLFALLWPADVLWWWLAPALHGIQPRWLAWTFGIFFAFMAVNATVVFGGTTARLLGVVCGVALILMVVARYFKNRKNIQIGGASG
jgi:hypothetical protein